MCAHVQGPWGPWSINRVHGFGPLGNQTKKKLVLG